MNRDKLKIVVIAGGLATRMKPITEQIPKCLVDIHGKPLMQHQVEFFKKNGYTDIIFGVAHLASKVQEFFGDGSAYGVNVSYVKEPKELLGTAGSAKLAEPLITQNHFIVYYGDNLTNMNFDAFVDFHKDKKALATICMRPLPSGYKSTSFITLKDDGKIDVFLEKPTDAQFAQYAHSQRYINSGIYIFSKEIFKYIPSDTVYDFAKQLFPMMIQKNMGLYGYPTTEFFREIGRVEKYEAFLKETAGKTQIL